MKLKQVLAVILSISLYAPHVAKLLAYADCYVITEMSNSDPRLCDCNRIIDSDTIPLGADQPDKQKDISLKADWKYIATEDFRPHTAVAGTNKIQFANTDAFVTQQSLRSVFHPPRN